MAAKQPAPAHYYDELDDGVVRCRLCPHLCRLAKGGVGLCGVRKNRDGRLYALTYGEVTGAAVDPVEKKPLYHFFPGETIYSIGGWGCNLKCVFCQNSPISQYESSTAALSPAELAKRWKAEETIGVAYTYNEPLIAIEYVMDCAAAVRKAGGKNVLVTNGFVNSEPLADLLPFIDAMNIDIKAFHNGFYRRLCGGSLDPVLDTVRAVVGKTHLELTTLLIPEANDAIPELEDLSDWIAQTCGRGTPCHLTAYHPSYKYSQTATTAAHLKNAWRIFRDRLDYVYLGNMPIPGGGDTVCPSCGAVVVARRGFSVDVGGMKPDGRCGACGAAVNIVVK